VVTSFSQTYGLFLTIILIERITKENIMKISNFIIPIPELPIPKIPGLPKFPWPLG